MPFLACLIAIKAQAMDGAADVSYHQLHFLHLGHEATLIFCSRLSGRLMGKD